MDTHCDGFVRVENKWQQSFHTPIRASLKQNQIHTFPFRCFLLRFAPFISPSSSPGNQCSSNHVPGLHCRESGTARVQGRRGLLHSAAVIRSGGSFPKKRTAPRSRHGVPQPRARPPAAGGRRAALSLASCGGGAADRRRSRPPRVGLSIPSRRGWGGGGSRLRRPQLISFISTHSALGIRSVRTSHRSAEVRLATAASSDCPRSSLHLLGVPPHEAAAMLYPSRVGFMHTVGLRSSRRSPKGVC